MSLDKLCFYSRVTPNPISSCMQIASEAVRYGVGGLELMNFCEELRTPDMAVAKTVGKFAKENGLALPCFSVGCTFLKPNPRETIEYLKGYANICSELEIPYLHHTIILELNHENLAQYTYEELMKLAVECSLEVSEYANARGVKTIAEDQGFVVNGVKQYSDFMARTGGKIGLLLDFGNIAFVDERADEFLDAVNLEVEHVHVKDYLLTDEPLEKDSMLSRGGTYITDCEMGTGHLPMQSIFDALKARNYQGYYSLEFPGNQKEGDVARSIERILKMM